MYTLREIGDMSVINMEKGIIIGTVDDALFNEKDGKIEALLIYGRSRLFGLLGRDNDVKIPWGEILSFGRDVIMVSTAVENDYPSKKKPFFSR